MTTTRSSTASAPSTGASSSTTCWPAMSGDSTGCDGSWRPPCSRRWPPSTARRSRRWPAPSSPSSTHRTGHTCASNPAPTQRQATTGRQVRWHPATAAETGGPARPPPDPGHRAPQGADLPAPRGPMRVVRTTDNDGRGPSRPSTRRPRSTGSATACVGTAHGQTATQDPRGLPTLPRHHPHKTRRDTHGAVTGEPDAVKAARPVRAGGRWKRT